MQAEALKQQTVLEQIVQRSTYQADELKQLSSAIFERVNRIADRREPCKTAAENRQGDKPIDFAQAMNISMTSIDESTNLLRLILSHLEEIV